MYIDEKIDELQNLTKRKITYGEIGDIFGVTTSAVQNRVYRKSPLKKYENDLLDNAFKEEIEHKITQVQKDFNKIKEDFENFVSLPVKNEVTASMGYGVDVVDETQTGTYQFSKKLLKDIGANPNYSDVIFSAGDSMYPTIEGGDCLVVDKSKTEIYDGKIYCVRIDGQLYAKRLQKIPPDKIKVISDNKDKYDAFYVDLSQDINYDFAVIGEVKWWSRVAK